MHALRRPCNDRLRSCSADRTEHEEKERTKREGNTACRARPHHLVYTPYLADGTGRPRGGNENESPTAELYIRTTQTRGEGRWRVCVAPSRRSSEQFDSIRFSQTTTIVYIQLTDRRSVVSVMSIVPSRVSRPICATSAPPASGRLACAFVLLARSPSTLSRHHASTSSTKSRFAPTRSTSTLSPLPSVSSLDWSSARSVPVGRQRSYTNLTPVRERRQSRSAALFAGDPNRPSLLVCMVGHEARSLARHIRPIQPVGACMDRARSSLMGFRGVANRDENCEMMASLFAGVCTAI